MNWKEQEALFWDNAKRNYWRGLWFYLTHRQDIIDCAYGRWATGYHTFGDRMFHLPARQIHREKLEECADLNNYFNAEG